MALYDDMREVARDVIGEFAQGSPVYVHVTPGNGPADEPGKPITKEYPLAGVARGARFKYVQRGLALATDLQITMAARDDVTPDMNGFIKVGEDRLKIVAIDTIPPIGVAVTHVIMFRK